MTETDDLFLLNLARFEGILVHAADLEQLRADLVLDGNAYIEPTAASHNGEPIFTRIQARPHRHPTVTIHADVAALVRSLERSAGLVDRFDIAKAAADLDELRLQARSLGLDETRVLSHYHDLRSATLEHAAALSRARRRMMAEAAGARPTGAPRPATPNTGAGPTGRHGDHGSDRRYFWAPIAAGLILAAIVIAAILIGAR